MHVWHNGNGNPSEWIDSLPGEGFFLETEQQRKTEWMSAVEKIPKKRAMSSSRSISETMILLTKWIRMHKICG
jgi:hypothetical protein